MWGCSCRPPLLTTMATNLTRRYLMDNEYTSRIVLGSVVIGTMIDAWKVRILFYPPTPLSHLCVQYCAPVSVLSMCNIDALLVLCCGCVEHCVCCCMLSMFDTCESLQHKLNQPLELSKQNSREFFHTSKSAKKKPEEKVHKSHRAKHFLN